MAADWIAALTAAVTAWKTTVDLITSKKAQDKENESKAERAVANAPDPTPPKE